MADKVEIPTIALTQVRKEEGGRRTEEGDDGCVCVHQVHKQHQHQHQPRCPGAVAAFRRAATDATMSSASIGMGLVVASCEDWRVERERERERELEEATTK